VVRPIVKRFKSSHDVSTAAAQDLFLFVQEKLAAKTRVDVAVTGGTVGIATLAAASEFNFNELDLSRLHIWWGDERYVAEDSSDRNSVQAQNAWLRKLDIPSENVHNFPSSDSGLTLEEAASQFNDDFNEQSVFFDLMLMGMGPDGHIASLFPGKSAGDSDASVVAEADSPKPPSARLSFSYRVINDSAEIWFTVAGSDKANAVAVAFGDNPFELPVGRIQGKEKTVWYVDQTAGNLVWGC
jgi:6-phosphogluconolactonase